MLSLRCSACSSDLLIEESGEVVCSSCGCVLSVVEERPPLLRKVHVTEAGSLGLGSYVGEIGSEHRWYRYRGFPSKSEYKRMKTIADRSIASEHPSESSAVRLILRLAEKLSLSEGVKIEAIRLASVLVRKKRSKKITIPAIVAFSVASACRAHGLSRVSMKDVVQLLVDMGYALSVSSILRISLINVFGSKPSEPSRYVRRVIASLSSSHSVRSRLGAFYCNTNEYFVKLAEVSLRVLERVRRARKSGHNPLALAATAVYAAEILLSRLERRPSVLTQKSVALVSGFAEYTIREQYCELFRETIETSQQCIIGRSGYGIPELLRTRKPLALELNAQGISR